MLKDSIRKQRERHGMSQAKLANEIGLTQQMVDKYEKGATVSAEVLGRIADALDCSADYLLGRDWTKGSNKNEPGTTIATYK